MFLEINDNRGAYADDQQGKVVANCLQMSRTARREIYLGLRRTKSPLPGHIAFSMNKRPSPRSVSSSRKLRSSTTKTRKPNSADTQVGESIRAHRLIARMSQSELAQRLGVSFQQVQKYEKGVNRVGAGRLPLIAEILNIPISTLFEDRAETSPAKGTAGVAPVGLITDPTVVKLLTSYANITDRETRRRLADLVDQIASEAMRNNRR